MIDDRVFLQRAWYTSLQSAGVKWTDILFIVVVPKNPKPTGQKL